MKNLENYGVQELDTKEVKEIVGGKNLIEYFAQGVGWCLGQIANGAEAVGDFIVENNAGANYVPGNYTL
jgi:hypothetical protein